MDGAECAILYTKLNIVIFANFNKHQFVLLTPRNDLIFHLLMDTNAVKA